MSMEAPPKHTRQSLLSWLAYRVGGWNASPGVHAGRLAMEPEHDDDDAVVLLILKAHKEDVTKALREEVTDLKAKLYDATRRVGRIKS